MKFVYELSDTCVRESIILEWDEKTYTLTTSAMRVGGTEHCDERKGRVNTFGARVQFHDYVTRKTMELYILSESSEYTWNDAEHEAMCMGNEHALTYNALLVGTIIPGFIEGMVRGMYT